MPFIHGLYREQLIKFIDIDGAAFKLRPRIVVGVGGVY